jgi:hypothetical protein
MSLKNTNIDNIETTVRQHGVAESKAGCLHTMACLMQNIGWHMGRRVQQQLPYDNDAFNVPWYDEVAAYDPDATSSDVDGNPFRPLTSDEWSTLVYPAADWVLNYEFDDRGVLDLDPAIGQFELTPGGLMRIKGRLRFHASATKRDVLSAIAGLGIRYGFFEGLRPSTRHAHTFSLLWGT